MKRAEAPGFSRGENVTGTPQRNPRRPLRVGCCGWSYREWVGPFYRTSERMFSQYARVFDTVEIDSSFYRIPERRTTEGLARTAPPGFIFTAKVPQALTHEARLRKSPDTDATLTQYLRSVEPLQTAGKLALVLVQLPPSFDFEGRGDLERFLSELRDAGFATATEFRHRSWLVPEAVPESLRLLRSTGSAYTIVDEPLLPPEVHVTGPLAYVRLHGRNPTHWYDYDYSDAELEAWKGPVAGLVHDGKEVIVVFNNHPHGNAPRNALRFVEMMGQDRPYAQQRLADF